MMTPESARFAETLAALDLVCPTCRRVEDGQLLLASLRPDADRALVCQAPACATRYPIIDGVPVVVRDPREFISSEAAFFSGAAPPQPGRGDDFLSTYSRASFADQISPVPGCEDLHEDQRQFLLAIEQAIERLPVISSGDGPRIAVDFGCGLGRQVRSLALHPQIDVAVGVDLRIEALRHARRWCDGDGFTLVEATGVSQYRTQRFDSPPVPGSVFLLADAADPPFRSESLSAAVALNLIDSTQDPLLVLRQLHATLQIGAGMLLVAPLCFDQNPALAEAWLGPGDPVESLETLLAAKHPQVPDLKFTTVARPPDLRWPLMRGPRAWSLYIAMQRLLIRA